MHQQRAGCIFDVFFTSERERVLALQVLRFQQDRVRQAMMSLFQQVGGQVFQRTCGFFKFACLRFFPRPFLHAI